MSFSFQNIHQVGVLKAIAGNVGRRKEYRVWWRDDIVMLTSNRPQPRLSC